MLPLPPPVRAALADALAVVLPAVCTGCGAPDRVVCAACRAALVQAPQCRRLAAGLDVWSGCDYDGPVARIVGAFKDGSMTEARSALAEPLRRAVEAALAGVESPPGERVLAVPVPSSARATRRRGYVPLELVARAARIPLLPALRVAAPVRDQAGLGAAERRANVAGALRAHRRLEGRRVLLLDDVVTTGSTLEEAARALREAGATVIAGATIAATPLGRAGAAGAERYTRAGAPSSPSSSGD